MKINWKEVWKKFNAYCDKREDAGNYPDWHDQKQAIRRIVNKQLKGEE